MNPSLPQLVKQRYGTDLIMRVQTLASIKPEISQALTFLLEDILTTRTQDDRFAPLLSLITVLVHLLSLPTPDSSRAVSVFFASRQSPRVPILLATAVSSLRVIAKT